MLPRCLPLFAAADTMAMPPAVTPPRNAMPRLFAMPLLRCLRQPTLRHAGVVAMLLSANIFADTSAAMPFSPFITYAITLSLRFRRRHYFRHTVASASLLRTNAICLRHFHYAAAAFAAFSLFSPY